MRAKGILVAALIAASPAYAGQSVMGEWLVQNGSAKVRFSPCAEKPDRLCGAITWLKEARDANGQPVRDANNPDPRSRSRAVVGVRMISDAKKAGVDSWNGGKLYDPGSGRTFDTKLHLNPDGTLTVQGCILIICQDQNWTPAHAGGV